MKICPICRVKLTPVDYEGHRVDRCDSCRGYAVPVPRVMAIKLTDEYTRDTLKVEAQDFVEDTPEIVRCPRCRMKMKKIPLDPRIPFLQVDHCRACDLIWFDGGELAIYQLAYEAGAKYENDKELKRRIQELYRDPRRRARFEAAVARLPESFSAAQRPLANTGLAMLEVVLEALGQGKGCA